MTQATDFKTTPEDSDLKPFVRDLRFHPCENAAPKVLTRQQIDDFNRDGYLKPFELFNDSEAAELRGYFDKLLAAVLAAGGNSYSISTAHAKHGRAYDLLTHPKVVAYVTDLLGENVVAWGSHFFCKMPGDGKSVAWHQDASYWPLSPSKAVTVWLAIDDADVENACMNFLAGSHHFGHLTYRASESSEHNVLNQTIDNAEQYGRFVRDDLKAGQFSIHSDLLLHSSDFNRSTRRRCGLTLRYCAADVRAEMGWNAKGVIVSGSDPTGHWANRSRPDHE